MNMLTVRKVIIYLLLIGGSVLFLTPLVWMISTSLKPLDQTTTLPPTWIPYRLYAPVAGRLEEVRRGDSIEMPSCVVDAGGIRRVVALDAIIDGKTSDRRPDGTETMVPARIIETIPASREVPWTTVTSLDAPREAWTVMPVSNLVKKAAPRWENYVMAIKTMNHFPRYLFNTLFLCVLTVAGTVLSSALAAYGFARVRWRGRNKVFMLALATMMIPGQVTMVPVYSLFHWLGMIGTMQPLWVGSFCAGAFNVFLLRQFFMTIPLDLSEAARIDGCSEFRIFWQIIMPLCRPALTVVGLFTFMGTWNDFMGPLMYLTDEKDFTLALGLQFFQSQHGGSEWHYLMAASTLIAMPLIILFFFTQKTFIEGISMTGLKG